MECLHVISIIIFNDGTKNTLVFFFSTTASLDQRWLSEVEAVGTLINRKSLNLELVLQLE